MIESHQDRPRELKWYHAGPMLYGDWGTSRFYVLGLAFFYSLHASFWYVVAVGLLVAAVGWAYTVVCRCFPDGGGVYSAARKTSRQLAVIGALLLCADYIVTAAMSAFDGMHYLGLPSKWVTPGALIAVIFIGLINYIGPRKAGSFALIVAMATLALTLVLVAFTIPHLAFGWSRITPLASVPGSPRQKWDSFVAVVLALSGVEAVANMTGIMVPPVEKTSRKSIWPVLAEVVILNIVLAVGMNALTPNPHSTRGDFQAPAAALRQSIVQYKHDHPNWRHNPAEAAHLQTIDVARAREDKIENAVLRVMASDFVGHPFAVLCGVVFGLLLISAVNTAVAALVSVQYVMARDQEMPRMFTRLNLFGVPWIGLFAAVGIPAVLLCIFHDLSELGDLYAIGVVGAITINLGSCSYNRQIPLKRFERVALGIIAGIMGAIELTLAVEKPAALAFALSVVAAGLAARFFTKSYPKLSAAAQCAILTAVAAACFAGTATLYAAGARSTLHGAEANWAFAAAAACLTAGVAVLYFDARAFTRLREGRVPVLADNGSSTLVQEEAPPAAAPAAATAAAVDMSRARIMVATRGSMRTLQFAANYARLQNGLLFVVFVRPLHLAFAPDRPAPSIAEDPDARETFRMAAEACEQSGVPMLPLYVVSSEVSASILDFAATYDVAALIMGVSRRTALLRALQGDTLTEVANNLPADIPLIIHA